MHSFFLLLMKKCVKNRLSVSMFPSMINDALMFALDLPRSSLISFHVFFMLPAAMLNLLLWYNFLHFLLLVVKCFYTLYTFHKIPNFPVDYFHRMISSTPNKIHFCLNGSGDCPSYPWIKKFISF